MASGSKMKIDMKHGFMKSIIKNQVDRDNYDKELKLKSTHSDKPKRCHNHQSKQKRPEQQTYVPPSRLRMSNGEDKESQNHWQNHNLSQRHRKTELFKLEYEDPNGDIFDLIIHKEDDPFLLARRFGNERGLNPPLIKALGRRLTEEIEWRLGEEESS